MEIYEYDEVCQHVRLSQLMEEAQAQGMDINVKQPYQTLMASGYTEPEALKLLFATATAGYISYMYSIHDATLTTKGALLLGLEGALDTFQGIPGYGIIGEA